MLLFEQHFLGFFFVGDIARKGTAFKCFDSINSYNCMPFEFLAPSSLCTASCLKGRECDFCDKFGQPTVIGLIGKFLLCKTLHHVQMRQQFKRNGGVPST